VGRAFLPADRLSSRSSRLEGGRGHDWPPHASEHAALGWQPLIKKLALRRKVSGIGLTTGAQLTKLPYNAKSKTMQYYLRLKSDC
jgi:hypothetical protein